MYADSVAIITLKVDDNIPTFSPNSRINDINVLKHGKYNVTKITKTITCAMLICICEMLLTPSA